MKKLEAMTPVEIDTKLSEIWKVIQKEESHLHWVVSFLDDPRNARSHQRDQFEEILAKHRENLVALHKEAAPYEAQHSQRGWNRYFLVTNVNGHVHRGMNCSTCFFDTQYAWLIELADCDEAEMVAEWGEQACTICFPDAPTFKGFADGTSTYARKTQEEKDAKAAEKAAKAAEKAAKAITNPDGTPLKGRHGIVGTKVAAQRELSQAVQNLAWYGPDFPDDLSAWIDTLTKALEAVGIETAGIITRAEKKVAKEMAS